MSSLQYHCIGLFSIGEILLISKKRTENAGTRSGILKTNVMLIHFFHRTRNNDFLVKERKICTILIQKLIEKNN